MGYISLNGPLFDVIMSNNKQQFYVKVSDKLAESSREYLINTFKRSIELNQLVGSAPDQDAIRAIIRSLQVIVKSIDPLILEANFKDMYNHLYNYEDIPNDISNILQDLIDSAIIEWSNSNIPSDIIKKVLLGEI